MFIGEAEAAGTIASAATKTKARIESLRLVILTKSPFETNINMSRSNTLPVARRMPPQREKDRSLSN
jgi:hypothetical protein